jgi:transcriptional regulator with XRE-family HTH domain
MRTIPKRITELRTAKGFTQSALARLLGVSRGAVHNWEAGHRTPNLEQAAALVLALGCTLNDLVEAPAPS